LAHAVYQRWFLQFDFPTGEGNYYKTNGGKFLFDCSLKKNIPIGWKVCSLSDLISKVSNSHDYSMDLPTVDLSIMASGDVSINQFNRSKDFATNLFALEKGNILFGAIRPYLKKCCVAPCDGAMTGTVYQFKPKSKNYFGYALSTMSNDFFFDYAVKISKGTKMPVVSDKDLLNFKVPFDEEIIKKFNELPFIHLLINTTMMSYKLNELKNRLIPLLINQQLA